jgi:hypothetical protein
LRKNANFYAENWQKSQKIVIITLAPQVSRFLKYFFFRGESGRLADQLSVPEPEVNSLTFASAPLLHQNRLLLFVEIEEEEKIRSYASTSKSNLSKVKMLKK